ncbi:putative Acid phosphatase [Helianthus annuus]|uniref:Acid phosphatase n=2 Tax=Helianthus annuus TaxID=4232 RepID=A0A251U117_HELAN|nr:putative Acid phosphatase [Helianthus annuus]KAJ0528184.1 putative Acid phosphatase [Helianthus annuus]KAJ0544610.1 putative Acid phosphatase [Helianthus annuus]KAJ0709617.1 putative Acid phosphatase [Helianthus annuus]KAJ0713489.1 putative Acid phosphatase [Helianthus annuus]
MLPLHNSNIHITIPKMGCWFFILMLTITTAVASPIKNQIHLLRPHSGSAGHKHSDINCLSWRLAVETDNLQDWTLVPQACKDYVGHYMLGKQYRDDCDFVAAEAYKYAKGLNLTKDGKDIWVFDIDETTLSNIPYYALDNVAFGSIPYNATSFDKWTAKAVAPAIPGSLKLYKQLIKLGFKIVFLTGTREKFKEPRIKNLKGVGYTQWEKLILKGDNDHGNGVEYKSSKRKELVEGGYRIRGNMGDQWSDLLGSNPGDRTFKVPDPMYYIA